jgi:hypothetical protein
MIDRSRLRPLLTALYVPLVTFLLLAIVNIRVAGTRFNPWSAAQNPRLKIASPVEGPPIKDPTALAVIRPLFPPESPLSVLTAPFPVNSPGALSILFVGNSQTIATMDEQPGDQYAPVWLWKLLNGSGQEPTESFALRIGSEPNLTMSELLIKSVLGISDSRRRMDVLVAAVMPDEFRWVDPREDFVSRARFSSVAPLMRDLLDGMEDLPAGARVVRDILGSGAPDQVGPPGARQAPAVAGQDRTLEDRLQSALDASLPLFGERAVLYGRATLGFHEARNLVFGVHTSSRRPIPDGMYAVNLQIVEGMLRYLRAQGVHAVIYLTPIRPIEPNPTDPSDLARFRRDMPALCARCGAICLDYSRLVPEEMWTNYPDSDVSGKGGERDFSHFTGRGHQRLGERLAKDLRADFRRWLEDKGSAPRRP